MQLKHIINFQEQTNNNENTIAKKQKLPKKDLHYSFSRQLYGYDGMSLSKGYRSICMD